MPLYSSGMIINDKYFEVEESGEYTIYVSCYGDNLRRKIYVNDVEQYNVNGTEDTGIKTLRLSVGDKVSVNSATDKSSGTYKFCSVAAFIVKN